MPPEDQFSHPGKIQSGDIYEVFSSLDESVLTTTEINGEIDWASKSTVRRQLNAMAESNDLQSKKAGNKENAGVVWYLPNELEEIPQPTPDPIKLVYRHQWFFLVAAGLFFAGFGFTFFMPGFFGEGLYLGLIPRDPIVMVSLALYAFGIAMTSVGSVMIIVSTVATIVQNRVN